MNDENTLEIIEQARRKMHETVDRRFDDLIALVQGGEFEIESDCELSLCDRPTYFKGKKPISVIYPDNTEFETSTWKKVAKQLLNGCAGDAVMCGRLHRLCGNVSGRDRVLLSESPDGMNSPICFADGMYLESNCCTDGTNFCGLDDCTEINMCGCNSDREDWRREGFDPELIM